jgi:hypothetical protein
VRNSFYAALQIHNKTCLIDSAPQRGAWCWNFPLALQARAGASATHPARLLFCVTLRLSPRCNASVKWPAWDLPGRPRRVPVMPNSIEA